VQKSELVAELLKRGVQTEPRTLKATLIERLFALLEAELTLGAASSSGLLNGPMVVNKQDSVTEVDHPEEVDTSAEGLLNASADGCVEAGGGGTMRQPAAASEVESQTAGRNGSDMSDQEEWRQKESAHNAEDTANDKDVWGARAARFASQEPVVREAVGKDMRLYDLDQLDELDRVRHL
jgi:hypothetical protein